MFVAGDHGYPVAPVYPVISLNSNILGTEPLFLPVM